MFLVKFWIYTFDNLPSFEKTMIYLCEKLKEKRIKIRIYAKTD